MKPEYLYVGVAVNHSYGGVKWISMTTPAFDTRYGAENAIEKDDLHNWRIIRVKL